MPGVYDYNSVNDAWRNGSVMDMVNNQVAQQQPTDADAFTRQANLYANIPVDYTGNINLANRPAVQNPDGSVSTVRSMSFNEDGKEVLVPTVSQDGRNLTPQQAIDTYHQTGQNLGKFDTPEAATEMARRIHDQQAYGVNNSVFNQTHRAENPQPVPTQPATQVASQGANHRPTVDEYTARAVSYLRNKGYSYADAMELMAPSIAAYKAEHEAQNQAMADDLIGRMQTMDIASPEYRQAAMQLYRLDPKLGQFMLKEGIGPKELYTYNRNRQDRIADREATNKAQLSNMLQRAQVQQMIRQQQQENQVRQLMQYGNMDERTARLAVYGGRGGRIGATTGGGGVSEKDYKRAAEGLKALDDEIAEGMIANPKFQLSPEKQQQYNMLYAIKQRGDNEFYARNGVGVQQQQAPRQKVNFNDYNSLKPAIDNLVKQNGGKFDESIARFIRQKAGIGADNKNPEEFLNIVFKNTYGFSG